MIDVPAYEQNELLKGIREEYGTGGAASEGASEAPRAVQDKLRPSSSKSGKSSGKTVTGSRGATANKRGATATKRSAKGSHSGKGRASTAPHKSNSSTDSSNRSTDNEIPGAAVDEIPAPEEKPSGLAAKPNSKEQKIRHEQEQQAAAASTAASQDQSPKNFFTWIRSNHRRKADGKEKEPIRTKPLSEREAEEIKPALLAALLDYFMYADELIYATNKAHNHVQIWASIDEEEANILVDVWLTRAKRDAKAASHVVTAVNRHMEVKVGLILAPRFYQTFRAYVDGGGISVR
jgi:hypothetical protein